MSRGTVTTLGTEKETPQGYLTVKTEDGWILKHRMVIEEDLGRQLMSTERVYFKDGNRKNCKLSNLEVRLNSPRTTKQLEVRLRELDRERADVLGELDEREESDASPES